MKWAKTNRGFTIVELLIVVVVIAILAAITIVAYNGIQNRAKQSAVTSEVSQALKKVESFKAASSTSSYPVDATEAGIANIDGVSYFYSADQPDAYCVQSTDGTTMASATNSSKTPKLVNCAENGLIGWWQLNGNGDDATGNGWGITNQNGVLAVGQNGQANSAYEYNGAGSAASISGSGAIIPEEGHTFSFWYYANVWNSGAATSFVAKRGGSSTGQFIMRLTGNDSLSIDCGGSGNRWTPSYPLSTGVWTHLVVTCSPTRVEAYVQGSRVASGATRTTGPIANGTVLQFGQDGGGYILNGRMDDIRLFDRVLTQAEVTQLYGAGAR